MSNTISFFQKLIKGGGGWNKSGGGGLENFSKINKRGGRLFGTREYISLASNFWKYCTELVAIEFSIIFKMCTHRVNTVEGKNFSIV